MTARIHNMHDREAAQPFASFGEQLAVVKSAALGLGIDPRLRFIDEELKAATGMSEAAPSGGGFAVQKQYTDRILQNMYDSGAILSRVNTSEVGVGRNGVIINTIDENSRVDGSRYGGVRGYWRNEAATVTASKSKFKHLEMALESVAALIWVTDEMVEDIPSLGTKLEQLAAAELTFKLENGIVRGTGSGQPLGIMNCDANIEVSKEDGQAADSYYYENSVKMYARMWTASRRRGVWLANGDVDVELLGMTSGFAGTPALTVENGQRFLHGRPIIPCEYCSTIGDVGDVIFTDLSQYEVVDRIGGVQSATSIHVKFLEHESAYRFTYRCNGQPVWPAPLTPFNGSNTQSPFVTLAERA